METDFAGEGLIKSEDGAHVYARWTEVNPEGKHGICTIIALNPATSDEGAEDPNLEAAAKFAANANYKTLVLVNLFSACGLDANDVRKSKDPIGPDNDAWIFQAALASDIVIVGWGDFPWIRQRARQIQNLLSPFDLYAVQINSNGTCTHPRAWKRKAAKIYRRKAPGKDQVMPAAG